MMETSTATDCKGRLPMTQSKLPPFKVLLVDDEEDFVEVLSERLEARGLKVETASEGAAALERARARSFDAIILDLRMPGMSGLETLKRLREANPELQIIFLTGRATVKDGIEAMKTGAFEFLEKPVDLNKLLELIEKAQKKKMELFEERMGKDIKDLLDRKGW